MPQSNPPTVGTLSQIVITIGGWASNAWHDIESDLMSDGPSLSEQFAALPIVAPISAAEEEVGSVTINVFGKSHMNATVTFGSKTITTGVANIDGVATVALESAEGATQSLSFSVPNGQAAFNAALESIGPIGPYSVF